MFNFFLWPSVIPIILPLIYCFIYKKGSLVDVILITISMILIIIFYWPLSNLLISQANIISKTILFILLPLIILSVSKQTIIPGSEQFKKFGITVKNIKKSLLLGVIFIPIMFIFTFTIKFYIGFSSFDANVLIGIISFFESFTEEFFFRGILFLYLSRKTSVQIAYITSLTSFTLIHPQYLTDLFIISTIVQGILTLEVCRRTKNLTGAWIIHGSNRVLSITLLPFLF